VPRAANLLREREQHIALLQDELAKTRGWLEGVMSDRQELIEAQAELTAHLEEHNLWALQLDQDRKAALERISDLQNLMQAEQTKAIEMAAAYQHTVDALEEENRGKTEWAIETERRLSAALAAKCDELAETVALLDRAEATVVERTAWAQDLDGALQQANAKLRTMAESPWVKLGRAARLAPKIEDNG
jgi:chromosome segregation ATPase